MINNDSCKSTLGHLVGRYDNLAIYRVLQAGKGKGKVRPRSGHVRPEREQRYISTLSLTSAPDGVGGQRHDPAALAPGKSPGTHCIGGWVGNITTTTFDFIN